MPGHFLVKGDLVGHTLCRCPLRDTQHYQIYGLKRAISLFGQGQLRLCSRASS
jgi:hypothetical protein